MRKEAVEARGSDPVVGFFADHGESLGEHDYWGHGRHAYDASLKIPMGIVWEGRLAPAVVEEPALRLYRRFSAKLARVGLERLDHEGPLDYLQRIASRRPDLVIPARSIIRQYIAIRYGEKDSRQQLDALARSVRRFSAR